MGAGRGDQGLASLVSAHAWPSVLPDRGIPLRLRRLQDGGRRQCRDPLLRRADARPDQNDPLLLQAKEAQCSVLERFVGESRVQHHGERVGAGPRLAQAASDIFLGWVRTRGLDGVTRDSCVRQFHDWKGGADVDDPLVPGATLYARICDAMLARAHARWRGRIAIASCLGKGDDFDCTSPDFSADVADQNERDYHAFVKAVSAGQLTAETGLYGTSPVKPGLPGCSIWAGNGFGHVQAESPSVGLSPSGLRSPHLAGERCNLAPGFISGQSK